MIIALSPISKLRRRMQATRAGIGMTHYAGHRRKRQGGWGQSAAESPVSERSERSRTVARFCVSKTSDTWCNTDVPKAHSMSLLLPA